jgi:hypothetical protein
MRTLIMIADNRINVVGNEKRGSGILLSDTRG